MTFATMWFAVFLVSAGVTLVRMSSPEDDLPSIVLGFVGAAATCAGLLLALDVILTKVAR